MTDAHDLNANDSSWTPFFIEHVNVLHTQNQLFFSSMLLGISDILSNLHFVILKVSYVLIVASLCPFFRCLAHLKSLWYNEERQFVRMVREQKNLKTEKEVQENKY